MTAPKEIRDNYEEILPGIYSLVPNEVYHASDGLSKTNVCDINDSIAQYNLKKLNPIKQTDPMIKGSAFHDLVLLPDEYHNTYIVSSTKGKDTIAYKKLKEDNPDKITITSGMSDDIYRMRDALYDNPAIREILEAEGSMREISIWVKDPVTGLTLKCRPDILLDGVIYDLKSTGTGAHARSFLSSVFKWKYFVQAPFYSDVCEMNGMNIKSFKFIPVESKPPHLTAIYDLNYDLLCEGRDLYRRALLEYDRYLNTDDKWDGLSHGRETVTL